MEEEEKQNKLLKWIDEHPKTTFWSRLTLWLIFAAALPCAFIFWRFKLFHKVSQMQISGWGIIAIVILALVVMTIIRYIKLAFKGRYSLIGQLLGGFCKIIIPLLALLAILNSMKDSIEMMIQVVGCVTICEAVAIPLNPLPKWAYEMQKDIRVEERKETVDYVLDGFFSRKNASSKSGN